MRKEEYQIAMLERHASGIITFNELDEIIGESNNYKSTAEAISLFDQSREAIEMAGWRQELKNIFLEMN